MNDLCLVHYTKQVSVTQNSYILNIYLNYYNNVADFGYIQSSIRTLQNIDCGHSIGNFHLLLPKW